MISFIHLSDIHFTQNSGDKYDVDDDLRNEIKLDIKHHFLKNIINPQGILICGDIAFSGQKKEYDVASNFINNICNIINISKSSVFCVPGNHDVDQSIPKKQPEVKAMQDSLASCKTLHEYNNKLSDIFRAESSAEIIYRPVDNYNSFSEQYNCNLSASKYNWKQQIGITDIYKLCILGLNSTIISNADDHATDSERLMKMSDFQVPQREDNTIFLTLCHHPPECWDDPEKSLQNKFNSRIHLQLYGHKHIQTIQNSEKTVIIGSGAMHPSRFETDWIPRYNWITLDVVAEDNVDYLIIQVYPRVYNEKSSSFEPDYNIVNDEIYIEFKLLLGNTQKNTNNMKTVKDVYSSEDNVIKSSIEWSKRFIYDFINLPEVCRNKVLRNLNLYQDEFDNQPHTAILADVIKMAEEQQLIDKLIEEVNKYKQ